MNHLIRTTGAAAIAIFGLAQAAAGAQAGAWETFFDEQNTRAWYVWDYADDASYYPFWEGTPVGLEYAYTTYSGPDTVSFNADELVGAGAFVGDYRAQRIDAIACDVFIGSLADLDFVDCALFATGPDGTGFHFSPKFYAEGFSGDGWRSLHFSFDELWDFWTGTEWVTVDPRTLTNIEQLEIAFTPRSGIVGGSEVGLDDVTLEPTLEAPQLTTAVTAGPPAQFRLAFTPGPGLECRVEKMRQTPTAGWDAVTGQTKIVGPAEHVFETPVTPAPGIFRVAAEVFYTMVFSD